MSPIRPAGRVTLLLAWLIASLVSAQEVALDDVTGPERWGAAGNVTRIESPALGPLYFSEQPDVEGLRAAQANGVMTVINVREPGEIDWDEASAARELGLEYFNIPISRRSDTLDPDALAQINAIIDARQGQSVLLHCASGNRAAAWFATHLAEERMLSEHDAIAIAERVGLTNESMRQRVETYFETSQ